MGIDVTTIHTHSIRRSGTDLTTLTYLIPIRGGTITKFGMIQFPIGSGGGGGGGSCCCHTGGCIHSNRITRYRIGTNIHKDTGIILYYIISCIVV